MPADRNDDRNDDHDDADRNDDDPKKQSPKAGNRESGDSPPESSVSLAAPESEPDGSGRGPGVQLEGEPGSVVVQDSLPDTMFVFPLRRAVPFPQLMMPLLLDTESAREIVAKAEAHNGYLFLVLQKDPEQDVKTAADLHEVGVVTRILKSLKLPDGGMSSMTQGCAARASPRSCANSRTWWCAPRNWSRSRPRAIGRRRCSGCCRSSCGSSPRCRTSRTTASPRRC
jgi:hypothetical protein